MMRMRYFTYLIATAILVKACVSNKDSKDSQSNSASVDAKAQEKHIVLAACRDSSQARLELVDLGESEAQIITGKLSLGSQTITFSADFDLAASEEDDEGLIFEGIAGIAETTPSKGKQESPVRMNALTFDRLSSKGEGLVTLQYGKQYVELSSCTFNKNALAKLRGQEYRY